MKDIADSAATGRQVVAWYHDKSMFYANNQRKNWWMHSSESTVQQPKEKGAFLMVADFISADYNWLCFPDGKELVQVWFKAGKE